MYTMIMTAVLGIALASVGSAIESKMADEPPSIEVGRDYKVLASYTGEVTAYSSTVAETDDTPFIAASGEHVYWGMIATNAHPFGTKVRFPEIYPDRLFTVGDRMNKRYSHRLDIWFPDSEQARRFGLQETTVEIVKIDDNSHLTKK
jgi:3D (Asp-Asp-Asp) domain-containing protein